MVNYQSLKRYERGERQKLRLVSAPEELVIKNGTAGEMVGEYDKHYWVNFITGKFGIFPKEWFEFIDDQTYHAENLIYKTRYDFWNMKGRKQNYERRNKL